MENEKDIKDIIKRLKDKRANILNYKKAFYYNKYILGLDTLKYSEYIANNNYINTRRF
jgi:hypothetical protein